jgi:PD-(D/E)XK nuclease superfamily
MAIVSPINPAIPRCPRCRAKDVIKKGTRKTRYEARQRWGCNRCGHTFTNLVTKHSPYPVKVILEAICRYNLSYSARETIRYLTRRFHIMVPEKTFRLWYTAHKPIRTYHTIRPQIMHLHEPAGLIETHELLHHQVYRYQFHRGKLAHLFSCPYHRAYGPVRDYLVADVPSSDFPHELFTRAERDRSSQYPVILQADVTRKDNYATRLAALALQIAPSNKKRHETLQRFMLLNDSATIAVEVPIYLTPEDFAYFRARGFTFPFGNHPITGHIDFLQLRAGFLHILDYKPEARKEKHAVTQLTIYALALSRRTGLPVKAFKCAWFDERDYFEFYPCPLCIRGHKKPGYAYLGRSYSLI